MSALQATPGPWFVDAVPYGSGMSRSVRAGSGKFAIATLHGDPRPAFVNEANARLIAAAPALYEALEFAQAMMSATRLEINRLRKIAKLPQQEPAALNVEIYKAKTALAQARGDTPEASTI